MFHNVKNVIIRRNIVIIDYENIKNYGLRCSAGTIKDGNDYKLENAKFQVRVVLAVHF